MQQNHGNLKEKRRRGRNRQAASGMPEGTVSDVGASSSTEANIKSIKGRRDRRDIAADRAKRLANRGFVPYNQGERRADNPHDDADHFVGPGAVAIGGNQDSTRDISSQDTYDLMEANSGAILAQTRPDDHGGLPIASTLVQDSDAPLVIATRDDRLINWKSRRLQASLCFVLVILISLVVGLVVALNGRSSGTGGELSVATASPTQSKSPTATPSAAPSASTKPSHMPTSHPSSQPSGKPSSSPTASPTSLAWDQIGIDVVIPGNRLNFGSATAVNSDGTRMVAATPQSTGGSSGDVSIFEMDSNKERWVTTSPFAIEGDRIDDLAGSAVSISGDGSLVAVGFPQYDGPNNDMPNSGLVRVFQVKSSGNKQVGQHIIMPSTPLFDAALLSVNKFSDGLALSNDGTRLVVSAKSFTVGPVFVFEFNGTDWEMITDEPIRPEYDGFSSTQFTRVAISADGRRVAVVDGGDEDVTTGFLRVWEDQGGEWVQVSPTFRGLNSGNGANDSTLNFEYLGSSISMSHDGKVVVVAGLRGGGYGDIGQVILFREEKDGTWVFSGDMEGTDSFEPRTVSLSGDGMRMAVQDKSGEVWVCEYDEATRIWRRIEDPILSAGVPEFRFDGEAVSLSADGRTVVIGAPELGIVRVFRLQGS